MGQGSSKAVRAVAVVAVTAVVGAAGYAAAGLAAPGSMAQAPISAEALAQIESDLHVAVTLEQRGVGDLKKATPAANKDELVVARQAKARLTDAVTVLSDAGFRASPPYNPISNAGNALDSAASPNEAAKYRLAALNNAIFFENKALALLPALAAAPSTTTAATTAQTTTSG